MHTRQAIQPIWKEKKLEEAEAKQKKAEEEAAASARRQAQKDFEEGQKKLLTLGDSLKKAKTEQLAKEKLADSLLKEYVQAKISIFACTHSCSL